MPALLNPLLARWNSFDRNVRLHFLNVGLFTLTLDGGINTVIFNLFMLRLGFGPEWVGTVNAVGMLAFALASLPVGRLGERWSYRRMVMVGAGLCVAGTLIAACAEFVPSAVQIIFMLAAVGLTNIGLASFFVNAMPYMVAFTNDGTRTSAFAIQSATGGVFAFAGSLIGGNLPSLVAKISGASLQTALPYRFTLLLAPLLLLIALRLGFIMRDPPSAPSVQPSQTPSHQNPAKMFFWLIAFFAFIRFLQVACIGGMSTFFNVYLDRELAASTANIGLVQATTRLLGIPVALFMPALSKKFGDVGVCIGASLLTACCALPIAFAPTWWMAGIGYIGVGIFSTLRYSTFMVFSMERTPAHLRGSCNGAQEMLAGLSFALVGLIGGALIAPLGYRFVFLGTAAITALGTFILWVYVRRTSASVLPVRA